MPRWWERIYKVALAVLFTLRGNAALGAQTELIQNGSFLQPGETGLPAGWTAWKPFVETAACRIRLTSSGLQMDAPQEPFSVGGVVQTVEGIQGGAAYAVEVQGSLQGIESPDRSVMVRLTWRRGAKVLHPAGEMVKGPLRNEGRLQFRDILIAPREADRAELSLELKWPQGGSVLWEKASLQPTTAPAPRKVKIGTVFLRPKNSTPEKNLELFCDQIQSAGKLGLDILCLPESLLAVGTDRNGAQTAEPIPGPSTERLGRAARQQHLWVVAGLYEKEGGRIYNTAVLLDRQGRLAGKYRKVHLPREEWRLGITPGWEYPVFPTDFGTIAIQICYDWFFPEIASIWGLKGAEIVLAPTWGTTFPDQDGRVEGETVFRVRARDNGLYLVPSVYDGSSMVIDPMGRILASNRSREGVFWAEVDLNQREALWWVGHWGSVGPRDRMPRTYSLLGSDPQSPR